MPVITMLRKACRRSCRNASRTGRASEWLLPTHHCFQGGGILRPQCLNARAHILAFDDLTSLPQAAYNKRKPAGHVVRRGVALWPTKRRPRRRKDPKAESNTRLAEDTI